MSEVIPLLPLYYNGVDRNDYAIELEPLTALLNKPQINEANNRFAKRSVSNCADKSTEYL